MKVWFEQKRATWVYEDYRRMTSRAIMITSVLVAVLIAIAL